MCRKVTVWLLGLVLAASPCQAGWVLGSDSDSEGMLKVFRTDNGMVSVQHCMEKDDCKEVARYGLTSFEQVTNYAQLTVVGAVRAFLGYLGLEWLFIVYGDVQYERMYGRRVPWARATRGALVTGVLLGLAAIPLLDSFDLERLYDYAQIYHDDFLNDEDGVILLPEDTVQEIIEELR